MKIEYDREVDALYIYLQQKEVAKTVELTDGVNIDLDERGKLIGIEIIDATQEYSLSDIFTKGDNRPKTSRLGFRLLSNKLQKSS
jgi:uncharacterized protein YuzE